MKVWVILGGRSAEREVSLDSGQAVARALEERGHGVWAYDLGRGVFLPEHSTEPPPPGEPEPGGSWAEHLLAAARRLRQTVEVAFLALHGGEGEGGGVQALLESAGVPYTGSGPAACAVSLDKALSKWIMEALDIPTPAWERVTYTGEALEPRWMPVVVKPVTEGSSVGIGIAHDSTGWRSALETAAAAAGPGGQLLIEEYIDGRELTVGILDDRALPIVEIIPRSGFYDYTRKYTPGQSEYVVPAQLAEKETERLQDHALRLYRAMGCKGMARVDFRVSPEGREACLELNTIPGLTSTSLLPKAAAAVGIGFGQLLEEVCAAAHH